MLPLSLKNELVAPLGNIQNIQPLHGGSINNAFKVITSTNSFFLKTNSNSFAYQMFEVEAKGLKLLATPNVIKTPRVIHLGKIDNTAFLVLDFIEEGFSLEVFWEKFGQQLAQLHQQSAEQFGLDHTNFIGSLYQSNKPHPTWIEFFINERMLPQISLAEKNQLLPSPIKTQFNALFKRLKEIFPDEPPALLHGDLWSGNFLKGKNATPTLVDPAVYFGHREMDLAMTYLFGGFDEKFYKSYNETFPLQPNFEKRVKVYQLYYLMVHVNLFGSSYLSSVQSILKKY